MEPLFYVLAIMGCGDGSSACTEARVMPARYESVQQCRAALPQALAENTDLSFPVISGACRSSGMHVVTQDRPVPSRG